MKKVKLSCMLAFIGAVMLSVTSCTNTDYGDDIAQLKNDVAELTNAIKSGKVVTSVTPIPGGNKLTFGDGTSIDILNGTNGTAGTNAFAPVLGVDTEGFWTIITTEGGTATRVKDANNKDVRAVASYPIIGENGNWMINGEDSGVSAKGTDGTDGTDGQDGKSPYICTNPAEGVVNNWMIWNGTAFVDSGKKAVGKDGIDGVTTANVKVVNGVLWIDNAPTNIKSIESAIVFNKLTNTIDITLEGVSYSLPLASNVLTTKTITNIACPEIAQYIQFVWGQAKDLQNPTLEAKRKAFTGKNKNDYFFTSLSGSFLVNPTEVDTEGYSIELVDPKDNTVPAISQEWKEFDYQGDFVQRAKAVGGLWTLAFNNPTNTQISSMIAKVRNDDYYSLAVKVTKGNYSVRSAYVYGVEEDRISNTSNNLPAPSSKPTVLCDGTNYDLTQLFGNTDFGKFYKWEISWSSKAGNAALKQYVVLDGTEVSIDNSIEAIKAVGGKEAEFMIQAVDYAGNYYEHMVPVAISKQTVIVVDLPAINYTLAEDNLSTTTSRENLINVQLQPLFDKLAQYGAVKTTFTYAGAYVNEDNADVTTADGFTFEEFVKGTTTDVANKLTANGPTWSSFNIAFDVTKARAVEYNVTVMYQDAAALQSVYVRIPVTVSNPTMNWSALFIKTDLFVGDKIKVYGNNETDQQDGTASYDLRDAYSTKPASNYFDFKYLGNGASPLTGSVCAINSTTVGVESKIGIVYYYFGNKDNAVQLAGQDFYATPRSYVADGSIMLKSGAKAEVTYDPAGGNAGSILMSATYVAKTVYDKTDLGVFGTRNALVQSVSVVATGINRNVITVKPESNDFRIIANNNTAGVPSLDVDLTITVTDQMGQRLVKTVKVTVKN